MSVSPLPRSLRITRQVTRGVMLVATAGAGVLGVHLAGDHHVRATAAPTARPSTSGPAPSATSSSSAPSTPTAPAAPPSAAPATPRRSATTPAAPRATAAPQPRFTPVAPVAPAAGSGTGGGTTSGS